MFTRDDEIHKRKVFARFDEGDLNKLLTEKLAESTGFVINDNTKIHIVISKKDKTGTAGFEPYAEVTLENYLDV